MGIEPRPQDSRPLAVPPGSAAASLARLDKRIAAGEAEVPELGGPPVTPGTPEEVQVELAEELVRGTWPSLADTLDDVERFVRRFVVFARPEAIVGVVLWVAHGHAIGQSETSPYLSVTSPEKRSGKTRLLEALELIVARPWRAVLPSEAVVYRKIAADGPTLLLDEVDAVFGPKTAAHHEGLRALLNAGNRRGVTVPRIVGEGKKMRVEEFPVFGAKVVAGIGNLPDTIADRSIPVRLVRRARGEDVERFRQREAEDLAAPIRDALAWHAETLELAGYRPTIPEALDDRQADGWEPLLAIADAAGGEWPERARLAALALAGAREWDDDSLGVQLLADVRGVFQERATDRMSTADLLDALREIEESPWAEGRDGRSLGPHGLARLLKPFDVRPKTERFGDRVVRGYLAAAFAEPWDRYLPPPSTTPVGTATPLTQARKDAPDRAPVNTVADYAAPEKEGREDRNAASGNGAEQIPWPIVSDFACSDYPAHQSAELHVRDPAGEWRCLACWPPEAG